MKYQIIETQFTEELEGHSNYFRIYCRILRTYFLYAELVKLAIPTGLRTVMSKHGSHVIKLMDLLIPVKFMFQISTDDRSRIFRSERHTPTAPVFKGIHFFRNDVRRFTDTP